MDLIAPLEKKGLDQITVIDEVSLIDLQFIANQRLITRQVFIYYYQIAAPSSSPKKEIETVVAAIGFHEKETYELVLFHQVGEPPAQVPLLKLIIRIVRQVERGGENKAAATLKQIAIDSKPSVLVWNGKGEKDRSYLIPTVSCLIYIWHK